MRGVGADVLQRRGVAVVLVDPDYLATLPGRRTLDVHVPLALGLALLVDKENLRLASQVHLIIGKSGKGEWV